jgi:hypothetical protein
MNAMQAPARGSLVDRGDRQFEIAQLDQRDHAVLSAGDGGQRRAGRNLAVKPAI